MRCNEADAGSLCEAGKCLTPVAGQRLSAFFFIVLLFCFSSCSSYRKLSALREGQSELQLFLPEDKLFEPSHFVAEAGVGQSDTLKVKDLDGNDVFIMKAIKDDVTGEMVATEVLKAAVITARFRNVAERMGKIDLAFILELPEEMQSTYWQVRLFPKMIIQEDSVLLDAVILTGENYRKEQERGYERYDKYLSRIVSDDSHFVDKRTLGIFLERNMPEPLALRTKYGVGEKEAIDHYTDFLGMKLNERRKSRKPELFSRYVKSPYMTESVRLDTVLREFSGDFEYEYAHTLATRPGLRKIDLVISGEIYEQDKLLYQIPHSKPLSFYVSSVSSFVDTQEKYITKLISRKAVSTAECNIDFDTGKSEIREDLGDNGYEIVGIKSIITDILASDKYELDSVSVTASASPEGSQKTNSRLSLLRAESASSYFEDYVESVKDSLQKDQGVFIELDEHLRETSARVAQRSERQINFRARSKGEDWEALDRLVLADTVLNALQKSDYVGISTSSEDPDERERLLSQEEYYPYIRDQLYPQLRKVRFQFELSRKGMIKDTVFTTQLDTAYMRGVKLIQDREYLKALELLSTYEDFNTALAYLALDRNQSALEILQRQEKTAAVNYMLAIIYSRLGDDRRAIESYMHSCSQDRSFVSRGNLDPEIYALTQKYQLNKDTYDYEF